MDWSPYLKAIIDEAGEGDSELLSTLGRFAEALAAEGDPRSRSVELSCVLPSQGHGRTTYVVHTPFLGQFDAQYATRAAALYILGEAVLRAMTRPCPVCNDCSRYARHFEGICRRCHGLSVIPVPAERPAIMNGAK